MGAFRHSPATDDDMDNRRQMNTARLDLRPIGLDDAPLMLAIWNDPAFIRNVGDRGIRSLDQAREAIAAGALKLFAEHGYGPFSMTRRNDGKQIGICGLFKRDVLDAPDIGFAVLPDYCGQGFAGEAAAAVVKHAREDLGLAVLTAIVSPDNAASVALIEKLGLRYERMITMPGEDAPIRLYRMALRHPASDA
jgi:RimJ/RimL family protein N-acetyltransferase